MKKAIYLSILTGFILVFTISACSKKLPNNGVPYYLIIDSVSLSTNAATQGSASSKIDQIWVEVGSQNLGVWELPARIPVLAEAGDYKVLITAGVKNKGISGQRLKYPFYQSESYTVTLSNKQEIKLSPIFKYFDITQFIINESFETSNNFGSNMNIVSDANVFEGTNSGVITAYPMNSIEAISNNVIIPTGSVAFIELNYKSNIAFRVGYEYYYSGSTLRNTEVTVNARDKWNKLYIELTGDIAKTQADEFRFYINTDNGDSTTAGQIYIDNFKVVYYN